MYTVDPESIRMVGKAKSFVTLVKIFIATRKKIKSHDILQHSHPLDLRWLLLATSMVSGKYLHK